MHALGVPLAAGAVGADGRAVHGYAERRSRRVESSTSARRSGAQAFASHVSSASSVQAERVGSARSTAMSQVRPPWRRRRGGWRGNSSTSVGPRTTTERMRCMLRVLMTPRLDPRTRRSIPAGMPSAARPADQQVSHEGASTSLAAVALSICMTLKNRSRVGVDGRTLELFPRCVESIAASVGPRSDVELVVSDYGSNDWPLAEWLHRTAGTIPVVVAPMVGTFSRGRGRNAAARVPCVDSRTRRHRSGRTRQLRLVVERPRAGQGEAVRPEDLPKPRRGRRR